MLFVWAMAQFGRTLPGQSPGRLGMSVALDLANLLERDPQTDLTQYVREQYAQYEHPFFVMMADGRLITSGSQSFAEPLLQMARARLARPDAFPLRPGGRGMRGFDGPRGDRDPNGPPFARPSPIVVGGRLAGVVVVPPQPPFGFLLGRYAPLLALVAGVRARRRHGADIRADLRARAPAPARCRNGGAPVWCRRSHRPCAGARRRRDRRGGPGVQSHGQGPVGARRRAGRVRPRPPSAAGRRLARVDDAGDRDARLPRNARDAGADAGRRDAHALSENHRRRNRQARTADRRSPGARPARRRRRDVHEPPTCRRRALRPGEGAARARLSGSGHFRGSVHRARRRDGHRRTRIVSSRRCRTWRQMRSVMRRAEPPSDCPRRCSRARGRSSLRSLPRPKLDRGGAERRQEGGRDLRCGRRPGHCSGAPAPHLRPVLQG